MVASSSVSMAFSLPADSGLPAAAASCAIHFGEMDTHQLLIFVGALAVMLAWVLLFGFMVSGSAKGARSYFKAWARVIKWTVLSGLVLAVVVYQLTPAP